MGTRVPKATIPTGSQPLKASDVASLLKWLQSHPILDGVELSIQLDTSGAQYFQHGLGRAYRQALKGGQSSAGGLYEVMTPAAVEANGQDPTKVIGIHSLIANGQRHSLWVF